MFFCQGLVESIHGRSIKLENHVESIQREWIDSTAGLWISSESSPRRRAARESRSRRRRHIFFCKDRAGNDGDGFNAVRLFRVISEDSAERDSLDESSAFVIEGAHCQNHLLTFHPLYSGSYRFSVDIYRLQMDHLHNYCLG